MTREKCALIAQEQDGFRRVGWAIDSGRAKDIRPKGVCTREAQQTRRQQLRVTANVKLHAFQNALDDLK
jgi:hypothetical protein